MQDSVFSSTIASQSQSRGKVIEFAQSSRSRAGKLVRGSGSWIKQEFTPNPSAVPWKGFLAGLAAGFAATAVMTAFQLGWSEVQKQLQSSAENDSEGSENQSSKEESSTVKTANAVSQSVIGRPLRTEEKEPASYVVHFAFGTLMGGIYGVSSEYLPIARLGHGLLHGLGLWAGADATALPALGFSHPVSERSATELSYEILSHAVYGVSTESVRKVVRGWMR